MNKKILRGVILVVIALLFAEQMQSFASV